MALRVNRGEFTKDVENGLMVGNILTAQPLEQGNAYGK